MDSAAPQGHVEPGFGAVADAFAANFEEHGDVGAAVAVVHDGRTVVDLWGGHADAARTRPWERDTTVMVFSTTKGVTATCAAVLVDTGELDPDEKIATYWPEFGAAGKEHIPVRWALSHSAGLAAVDGDLTIEDVLGWDGVVAAIAAQEPNWEPGTGHGYHVRSYGWIVGEIIRRITGRTPGSYFREAIGDPHQLSFWIGLPPEQDRWVADLIPDAEATDLAEVLDAGSLLRRAGSGPSELFAHGYDETWNSLRLRRAELPSSNGIGDARSLARLYALIIGSGNGPPLVSGETLAVVTEPQSMGTDLVIGMEMNFALGYMLPPTVVDGAPPGSFGHGGAGGSLAFADPSNGLGFGYVMNQMRFDLESESRAAMLVDALYTCVDC